METRVGLVDMSIVDNIPLEVGTPFSVSQAFVENPKGLVPCSGQMPKFSSLAEQSESCPCQAACNSATGGFSRSADGCLL
jgi:hypothetical protein